MRKILTSGRNWTAKAEFEKQDLLYIELHFILVKGNPKPDRSQHDPQGLEALAGVPFWCLSSTTPRLFLQCGSLVFSLMRPVKCSNEVLADPAV